MLIFQKIYIIILLFVDRLWKSVDGVIILIYFGFEYIKGCENGFFDCFDFVYIIKLMLFSEKILEN